MLLIKMLEVKEMERLDVLLSKRDETLEEI